MNDNDGLPQRGPRLRLVITNPTAVPADPAALEDYDEDDAVADPPLVEDSPYSALLRADLPDDLRAQALHGLWRGTFAGDGGGSGESE